jgi:hypothetical protein
MTVRATKSIVTLSVSEFITPDLSHSSKRTIDTDYVVLGINDPHTVGGGFKYAIQLSIGKAQSFLYGNTAGK